MMQGTGGHMISRTQAIYRVWVDTCTMCIFRWYHLYVVSWVAWQCGRPFTICTNYHNTGHLTKILVFSYRIYANPYHGITVHVWVNCSLNVFLEHLHCEQYSYFKAHFWSIINTKSSMVHLDTKSSIVRVSGFPAPHAPVGLISSSLITSLWVSSPLLRSSRLSSGPQWSH